MNEMDYKKAFAEYGLEIKLKSNAKIVTAYGFDEVPLSPVRDYSLEIGMYTDYLRDELLPVGNVDFSYIDPQIMFLQGCDIYDEELGIDGLIEYVDDLNGNLADLIDYIDEKEGIDEIPAICYIEQIYIEPEFRECGIGTYVWENLHKIIMNLSCFSIEPNLYTTVLDPGWGIDYRRKVEDDEYKKMMRIMKKTAVKAGFTLVELDDVQCCYRQV